MGVRHFDGGPWDGQTHDVFVAVPSLSVPVYAEPEGSEAVCADEQVVVCLGHYVRAAKDSFESWRYEWEPCAPSEETYEMDSTVAGLLPLHTLACQARYWPELGKFVCTCEYTP